MPEGKRYWKSSSERDRDPAFLSAAENEFAESPVELGWLDRRDFLKAAGFAVAGAALSGCGRAPVQTALPLVSQPEQITPGRPVHYASTCGACSAGCGILAKCRDGRPIKLEGNPEHPLSHGGLCAVGQASLLGLYDSQRLQNPRKNGQDASWEVVDHEIRQRLEEIRRQNGAVRILSGTVTSPTLDWMIRNFMSTLPNGLHIVYDPLSSAAILDAHRWTHGIRVLPCFHLERADSIVSFDADFLGTWISPVEFTHAYKARRTLEGTPPRCSLHVQFESRLSLTGSKADQRHRLAPGDMGLVMTYLADRLDRRVNAGQSRWSTEPLDALPIPAQALNNLADELLNTRGRSLVLCGSQELSHQLLCNLLNHLLGNYGHTIDVERPSLQRQGSDGMLQDLLQEVRDNRVAALFLLDSNPIYHLPGGEALRASFQRIPLVVSCAERLDETAALAHYVCPHPHFLASWGDAEPVSGVVALSQPTFRPLGNTRPILESLAAWGGESRSSLASLRQFWEESVFPRRLQNVSFQAFWDQALHDGFAQVEPARVRPTVFNLAEVRPVSRRQGAAEGAFALVLYPKVGLLDGRSAYNPWLQELPDPITKVTWDNYACLSPAAAAQLQVRDGDVVRLETAGTTLELPALVQPGQHDQVAAVALGYGSVLSARFAGIGPRWLEAGPTVGSNGLVGSNAAALLVWQGGSLKYQGQTLRITKTGRHQPLASTQGHNTLVMPANLAPADQQRRPIVQETTLAALAGAGAPPAEQHADLWPADHLTPAQRWAMVIDLNACTGCSACVVACQAENNIPVVGKDEVRRQREMHWLRIDRYYAERPPHAPPSQGGDRGGGDVDVAFQPMMCQHCGNAPCETVCPVLATVHSSEGLNQQVYNRCVGTRYCANNCPYKVRRFNWFNYPREDTLQNLVLNPDVTVRSRGVMEKCSFCVQRIQEARIETRRTGAGLFDGSVLTACQQSCPAQAIVFGDLNDPQSKVAQLQGDPRRYQVLGELNVRPSVSYLQVVRNRTEGQGERHE